MKRLLSFALLLLLAFSLAACGDQPDEAAVPMPTDGGDEAQIQLDPSDPLANYLDLSKLPEETVSAAIQELNLTSQDGGCQATLQKALGDAMTLYLSLEVTYPEGTDLSDPTNPVQAADYKRGDRVVLAEGTITDPAQMPDKISDTGISSVSFQGSQTGDRTATYLIAISYRDAVLTPGKEVTLLYEDRLTDTTHLFHWTVENQAPVRQAELKDQAGNVVGTGVISPFAACLTIQDNAIATSMEPDQLLDQLAFLGENDTPIDGFRGGGVNNDSAPMIFEAIAFVPVLPDQISSVQLGENTLQVVWADDNG